MIAIIDYGMGNFQSIENAFKRFGQPITVTYRADQIRRASKIVLIGVGNFGEAVKNIKSKALDCLIKEEVSAGKPLLGICLGFQLLFEKSQESPNVKGLGLLKGECKKFTGVKIPQLGWNQVQFKKQSPLFQDVSNESFFYFMHSFFVVPDAKDMVTSTTNYGKEFCSAVQYGNIFGVQFHPEKSGKIGLTVVKNFIALKHARP